MNKPDVTLERMRSFVRVAERGNLSAVARELGVGQSTITRHLRELEDAIGVPLINRTTRHVALTDEGRRYRSSAIEILRLVDEAADEIRGEGEGVAGSVRVSCSAFFGVMHACRLIFAFQDRYPGVRVDFVLTDERTDLVRDGVDIAIQIGPQPNSEMMLRSLGQFRKILVAAPRYLERHGRPTMPEDLSSHEVIRKTDLSKSGQLVLTGPGGELHIATFKGRFRVDQGLAAREALIAGRGISPVPRWLVDDLIEDGKLEIVLPGFLCPPIPLNMLIVPERSSIRRVQLLKDFLVENVKSIPGVE
jgi:DNA-binding transcriptional LysR family regulator